MIISLVTEATVVGENYVTVINCLVTEATVVGENYVTVINCLVTEATVVGENYATAINCQRSTWGARGGSNIPANQPVIKMYYTH